MSEISFELLLLKMCDLIKLARFFSMKLTASKIIILIVAKSYILTINSGNNPKIILLNGNYAIKIP